MSFRIFDHILAGNTWSATGRLCLADAGEPHTAAAGSAGAETTSLLDRLILRSKRDRVLCRAARRFIANPTISLGDLAGELGVSERYLLSGLRAALGGDPQQLFAALQTQRESSQKPEGS